MAAQCTGLSLAGVLPELWGCALTTLVLLAQNKAKKKKKGVVPGGGLKATMKDDLADYGGYDGEYVQDFEDFM